MQTASVNFGVLGMADLMARPDGVRIAVYFGLCRFDLLDKQAKPNGQYGRRHTWSFLATRANLHRLDVIRR